MNIRLTPHPDTPCPAVKWIVAELERTSATTLKLHYKLAGAIGDLQLPPWAEPARTSGLWRHTCFELFLRAGAGPGYLEFNFSPSTQWAVYRFTDYRAGMIEASEALRPRIRFVASAQGLALVAEIDNLPAGASWRLGLAAVIEEVEGTISYWALSHPPGEPDFHHPDCFALELPPVETP